jgi:hypothetical protein
MLIPKTVQVGVAVAASTILRYALKMVFKCFACFWKIHVFAEHGLQGKKRERERVWF